MARAANLAEGPAALVTSRPKDGSATTIQLFVGVLATFLRGTLDRGGVMDTLAAAILRLVIERESRNCEEQRMQHDLHANQRAAPGETGWATQRTRERQAGAAAAPLGLERERGDHHIAETTTE